LLVVLDADVIVAGTIASAGACHDIVDAWLDGDFEVAVCAELVGEVEKALKHPRIADKYGLDIRDVDSWVDRLESESTMNADPVDPPRVVPDDAGGDYLIALADAAHADVLVTRDRHFSKVRPTEGFEIVSPRVFLDHLRQRG
jgi:putative PIN family toxin of toxin-antitoxin system